MSLEILLVAIYLVAAGVSLWSLTQLNRFLDATPAIADRACLERFKALARVQMYLALAVIALLAVGILTGMAIVARHGLAGLLAVILINVLLLGLGLYHKKVEARARGLQAGSEALANEYRRISETWVKKALPDF